MKVTVDISTGKVECEVGDRGPMMEAIQQAVKEWIDFQVKSQVTELVRAWVKEETEKQKDLIIERLRPEIIKTLGEVRIDRRY